MGERYQMWFEHPVGLLVFNLCCEELGRCKLSQTLDFRDGASRKLLGLNTFIRVSKIES
jgi:hypothetical protein